MCGIVGYAGPKSAGRTIYEALKRLEYRGYDSAGIATISGGLQIRRGEGKIDDVHRRHNFFELDGNMGIGHTRWATHGAPSERNAHPLYDCTRSIAIVHNGVIENYQELRARLSKKGHKFHSETDSETIAHLIEENMKRGATFEAAARKAVKALKGSYAIAAIHKEEGAIVLARNRSPLVIGVGEGEMMAASDVPAMLDHTRKFIFMEDGDFAVLTSGGVHIEHGGRKVERKPTTVTWTSGMAEKEGYAHFTLKEIHEQEQSIALSAAVDVGAGARLLKKAKSVHIIGCGTSYHASLVFKQLLAARARIDCDAFVASEYAYSSVVGRGTVVIAVTQSGETLDTMMAARHAKAKGAKVLAITNVVGSSITRLADETVYMQAGPEVGVVATKTFTSQVVVLTKLALALAGRKFAHVFTPLVKRMLAMEEEMKRLAAEMKNNNDYFFIGRGIALPIAYEGALKLKEIAYVHAEAYAGGELKHGPLSLIADGIPVIALAPSGEASEKMFSNVKECKARGGRIIALSDDAHVLNEADVKIRMPKMEAELAPLLYIIPLQFFAYYACLQRGHDPDRPRNLAKSVTVE